MEKGSGKTSPNKKYMTEQEFLRYIGNNKTNVTLADFDGVDIERFVARWKLTNDSIGYYLLDYLEDYKFELIYPNHSLLAKEEFFKMLEAENLSLTADSFEGIDTDDFIYYAYHCHRDTLEDLEWIGLIFWEYLNQLEQNGGRNYTYLFTKKYVRLGEEDIPSMLRLYYSYWSGNSCGLGIIINYLLDFEEHTVSRPLIGDERVDFGVNVRPMQKFSMPRDTKTRIGEILVEHRVPDMEQDEFPGCLHGTWELCIELTDGRIVRYSYGDKVPSLMVYLIECLNSYIDGVEHLQQCAGCDSCDRYKSQIDACVHFEHVLSANQAT